MYSEKLDAAISTSALLNADLAGLRDGVEIRRSALMKASVSAGVVMRGESLFARRLMDRGVQSLDDIVRRSLGRHHGIPGHPRDR